MLELTTQGTELEKEMAACVFEGNDLLHGIIVSLLAKLSGEVARLLTMGGVGFAGLN